MKITDAGRVADILLVEDNDDDVVLTERGFKKAQLAVNLHRVENGKKCLEFLRREGEYAAARTPDLILLDLNMPVMDGREVMAEIVNDDELCKLPVVILTTSAAEADLLCMYKLRCNTYITKPVDFHEFQKAIEDLANYWFKVAMLPPA